MRLLGNIIWHFPFLGFLNAFWAFIFGTILVLLIIPAPIGLGLIQYSKFLLAPYSYQMTSMADLGVKQNPLWEVYSFIIMILYLPFGIVFAIISALQACLLFISIIGIPVAIPLFKSLGTYLNPVGKRCIPLTDTE